MTHVKDEAQDDENQEDDDQDNDDGDGPVHAELLKTVEGEEDLVVPAVGRHVVQVHVLAGPPPHVGEQVLDESRAHSFLAMLTILGL
jgi:hypothetical protein